MKTVAALPRVLGISLVFAAIAYACTFLIKPTYQSESVFYFPQSQSSGGPMDLLQGSPDSQDGTVHLMAGLVSPLIGAAAQTASGIITSHTATRNTVDELNLDRHWKVSKNDAYMRLANWTDAKVQKTGMLSVTATAESPQQAVDILKSLESYLDRRSGELTLNVSRSNRMYLEKRVAQAEGEVNRMEQQYVRTMQSSPMANLSDLMKGYFEARTDLEKAQVAVAAGESKLQILEDDARRALAGGNEYPNNVVKLGSVNQDVRALSSELQARHLALEDTLANFTKNSPEYLRAKKAVDTAEGMSNDVLDASKSKVNSGLTPDLIQARSELGALKSAASKYSTILQDHGRRVLQAPGQYAAVQRMQMEFDTAMKGFGLLRQQLELAKLAESRDPSRFAVIDEPFANPKPVGPRRAMITAIVFVLAGLVQLALMSLKNDELESEFDPALNGHSRRHLEVPREELETRGVAEVPEAPKPVSRK
ncbi:MAG: hypothetical protein QOJ65_753 [Fimbriimonadaceae bacterium]|jgi:uncharacterized protein involved in exopolysaccharide biosynthesis|nr:hypothetical protein [Fimbriimonadaceae bacterium]